MVRLGFMRIHNKAIITISTYNLDISMFLYFKYFHVHMLYKTVSLLSIQLHRRFMYFKLLCTFQDNPGEDSAILLISFLSPQSSKVTPQLYLSPKVEQ